MSKIYRVRDWDKHFENNRTRDLKKMDWVPVPNKHDGSGFCELMDHTDAMAHYGAWHLILQVASKCGERGTLLREGAGGVKIPHTPQSLARITHGSAAVFEAAIERLVNIGWLEVYNNPAPLCGNPAPSCAEVTMEGKGREGKEGKGTEGSAPLLPLDSITKMVKAIQNARPEFCKVSEMAIASALNGCPESVRENTVKDFVENTANSLETPKNPLALLKGYIRTASKETPSSGPAVAERKKRSRDLILGDIVEALWDRRNDDRSFKRCLSVWRDKTRDMPGVVDEAMEIIQFRRESGEK